MINSEVKPGRQKPEGFFDHQSFNLLLLCSAGENGTWIYHADEVFHELCTITSLC